MEMKTIQEVLKEYSVELKSADAKASIYACKRLLNETNLTAPAARLKAFQNATRQSDLFK
jgi:hypothetical protein